MRIVYKGKFDGNPESLPHGEHQPGAVKFREAETPEKMAKIANALALGITAVCMVAYFARAYFAQTLSQDTSWQIILGAIFSMVALFPHEILHGLCFRETVYLYTYWDKGALFVVGSETMSKARFVFMSLCPNLVFGVIPFVLGMIRPEWTALGALGVISIGAGAGDYMNVFHALTQMPKGARTYLYQFNSWWYLPQGKEEAHD